MAASTLGINYTYDYYSGSNIGVFIGDQLLTTVLGIQFNHMQAKTPIYGYASSLYDGMADGHVIVDGRFFLNFTQAQLISTYISRAIQGSTGTISGKSFTGGTNANDAALDASKNGFTNLTPQEIQKNKDQFWGASTDSRSLSDINLPATSEGLEILRLARPDQHLQGFDILITYGKPFTDSTGFTKSTLRVIRDVHITGFGQTISVDGEPVIESYSFIARSVT